MADLTVLQIPEASNITNQEFVIVTNEQGLSSRVRLAVLGLPYDPVLDSASLTARVVVLESYVGFYEQLDQRHQQTFLDVEVLQQDSYLMAGRLQSVESQANELGNSYEQLEAWSQTVFPAITTAQNASTAYTEFCRDELYDYIHNGIIPCIGGVQPITVNPADYIRDEALLYPSQLTPGSFRVDSFGRVQLQGYYRTTQVVNVSQWVCSIPEQYAPANGLVFCVGAGASTFVLIAPDGKFYVHRTNWTSGAFAAFSQISYYHKGVL